MAAVAAAEGVSWLLRFVIAVVFAALTLVFVWGIGHQKARVLAKKNGKAAPRPWSTFVAGFWSIAAATAAAFVWATVVPGSWAGFTEPYQPLLIGAVAGLALAALSFFFGDLPEG